MKISRAKDLPKMEGPSDWFTGSVEVEMLFNGYDKDRVQGSNVTFQPGARTAWHTHPLGQTIVVTAGVGRVQKEGGPIETVQVGDVVWFEPDEKHWHGAAPDSAMTHTAIQEVQNGKVVDWMEHVSDEEYGA